MQGEKGPGSNKVLTNLAFYSRRVRGILNKLTPEKFEKLSNDILNVGLDSTTILKGVILLVSNSSHLFSVFIDFLGVFHCLFSLLCVSLPTHVSLIKFLF